MQKLLTVLLLVALEARSSTTKQKEIKEDTRLNTLCFKQYLITFTDESLFLFCLNKQLSVQINCSHNEQVEDGAIK